MAAICIMASRYLPTHPRLTADEYDVAICFTIIQIQMIATVKYQVATYSGEVQVNCNENDEDEVIIVKQRAGGSLPFGYESWKVVGRS